MNIFVLPQYLQQGLKAELQPGESILWIGQPNPERYMKSGFKLWFLFGPWTAFALFWIAGASDFRLPRFDSGWSLFPLFGLPFLLIGLAGLSSPLWLRRRAHSTVYAITNQRAISIQGSKSITVNSYLASGITNIECIEYQDGTGDLILRTESYRDMNDKLRTKKHGFFAVDDVRHVENLIRRIG